MHDIIQNPVYVILFWSTIQYGMKTFPMPDSKLGKWVLGVVQFALTNSELAKQNFRTADYQGKMDDLDKKNGPSN